MGAVPTVTNGPLSVSATVGSFWPMKFALIPVLTISQRIVPAENPPLPKLAASSRLMGRFFAGGAGTWHTSASVTPRIAASVITPSIVSVLIRGSVAPQSADPQPPATCLRGRPPRLPFSRDAIALAAVRVRPPAAPSCAAIQLFEPNTPSSKAGTYKSASSVGK
jgi:hypothetical protein